MKPLPPTFALNCPNDCWLVVAPHYDPPDLRPAALATGGLCAHRRGQRRAPRAAAAARGALYSEMARMTDRMTLIIKHEAVKDTGSFEVRFRDGRPSVFFYGTRSPAVAAPICSPANRHRNRPGLSLKLSA
jgi:hypothetical protein